MPRKPNYESRLQDLSTDDKSSLISTIKRMSSTINARFRRLERENEGLTESAYIYAQKETGKEKPRYPTYEGTLEKMSISELKNLGKEINKKLVSKTSTISGLEIIEENRIQGQKESIEEELGVELDINQWKTFLKNGGGQMLNEYKKYMDSFQVIDDYTQFVQGGKMTKEEFLNVYNMAIEKGEVDYSKIRKGLKAR